MAVTIVGGGLAGCEAAWYLAERGVKVTLYEMRPEISSPAHVSSYLAELVCSNSLKSDNTDTAAGLLKAELRFYKSLLMDVAENCRVPSGAALAVDRELFGAKTTQIIESHPNINVIRAEMKKIPQDDFVILACGPLATDAIADDISKITDGGLSFVDAISPVISAESINMDIGYFAGRYGKGGDDYLNLPLTQEEYDTFYDALIGAETVKPHDFENAKIFERCMPIEVIAARGKETLLYGPMRPVGLRDPRTEKRPFAVVQLRFENKERTAFNIVGFQTKMTIGAQKRVLRLIPGLENAEFLRYGTIHRNTYINAPKFLNSDLSLRQMVNVYMAGQITGVEGYLESMASGIIAAMQVYRKMNGESAVTFDSRTAFGALSRHVAGEFGDEYMPGNFHFGMLPPLETKIRKKAERKAAYAERALNVLLT